VKRRVGETAKQGCENMIKKELIGSYRDSDVYSAEPAYKKRIG
jgi:hypothetical protein